MRKAETINNDPSKLHLLDYFNKTDRYFGDLFSFENQEFPEKYCRNCKNTSSIIDKIVKLKTKKRQTNLRLRGRFLLSQLLIFSLADDVLLTPPYGVYIPQLISYVRDIRGVLYFKAHNLCITITL